MGEMQDKFDAQLLRDYAEHGSETVFREPVTRHTDFVYSAALFERRSLLTGPSVRRIKTPLKRFH